MHAQCYIVTKHCSDIGNSHGCTKDEIYSYISMVNIALYSSC